MANKPAQLCQLQKGIMVDSQKGFVDTFNWAVNAIANINGGQNCDVNWTVDDQPTIDCTVDESDVVAVYDVVEATSNSASGIEVQYVDDRATTFIPFPSTTDVSAVYDVVQSTSGSQSGISIQYVDARADTFIPIEGGGSVQFTGTNGTTGSSSNAFTFATAQDANVVVKCYGTGIEIGVYYV